MKVLEKFLRYTGVFLIAICLTFFFFRINGFFSNKKSEIIKSDGLGYYSYLPAMFIHGDYTQGFVKEKFPRYYSNTGLPEYMQTIHDRPVDKYFFGTAVLMYPFFMTAHWLSLYFNQPADGYSVFYQYFMGLSAIFYVFLGIYFCNKLLRIYGATVFQSLLICTLIVFGTNLYYYAAIEPTMSHAYSFAAIAAFLFYSKSIFESKQFIHIIPAFIALGFVVIIRPFNLIVLLALPFLAGSIDKLKEGFIFLFRHYVLTISGAILVFFIVSLQFFIWYKQTGHFIVYSYTYERFYFDKPNMMNVLLSYRKGLFIYTPLCFIGLIGLFMYFRKNRFASVALFVFFFVLIYVMSSWHQWYYGSSFGFRPMIEFFPLLALLLLFFLQRIKKTGILIPVLLVFSFLTYVNQVQAYQYRKFILHWDKMSRYKYWKVFLKDDDKWIGYVWDNPESTEIVGKPVLTFKNDFEKSNPAWDGRSLYNVGSNAYSGNWVTEINDTSFYSNTLFINRQKGEIAAGKLAVRVSGYIKSSDDSAFDKLKFTITYNNSTGEVYYYRDRPVDFITDDSKGWKKFDIGVFLDNLRTDSDIIKFYFWNPDKKKVLFDDLTIEIFSEGK